MKESMVIVTCIKDMWNFEMLCISIEKYLQPTVIYIIYNDSEENYDKWYKFYNKKLYKYLRMHKVIIKTKRDYWNIYAESHLTDPEKDGWVDQQVLKLVVARDIKSKTYVCIDSKNFFIRPTSIEDIAQITAEPITWTEPVLENWVKYCCKTLKISYPGNRIKLTQNTTPYRIDTEQAMTLIQHFSGIDNFYKWFTNSGKLPENNPSEFFLYELWLKKQGIYKNYKYSKQNSASMWGFMIEDLQWKEQDFVDYINEQIVMHDVKVAGLHKTLLTLLTEDQIKRILAPSANQDLLPSHNVYEVRK